MAGIGHNSAKADDTFTVSDEQLAAGNAAAEQLRLFIERIERLEEEKKGVADDIKDVYLEAKANGYDTKMMRQIIAIRKMDPNDYKEMSAILQTYLAALGME